MKKIKLILLFCAIFLSVLLLTGDKDRIQADDDDSNFTNLVVFARFAGETEFINDVYEGSSVRKITDNSYNAGSYSVGDYYRCVSDNKLRMRSVYLYDNGGSIVLSHPRGYYAEYSDVNTIGYKDSSERAGRMYDLKLEWSEAVNNAIAAGNKISNYDDTAYYGYNELDKDNNGTIDSITIIYKNNESDNISVSWSSPLWNYMDYADYISVNTSGKIIKSDKYVQLTNSYCKPGGGDSNGYLYKDEDGLVSVSIATAVHEMGHIMGLKDLYNSNNVSPVYFMSVMAKHLSPVPQFMSLKEKEVLGWVDENDIKTILSEGEYSLKALGTTENGNISGYKMDIPVKGKTLYLEYRNFEDNGNKYDSQYKQMYKINGNRVDKVSLKSGLVCYLIDSDTKFPSNMYFSSPKWNYEVVGGQYSTKSDAALGIGDDIWIYGDIYISVKSIENNTLTFEIEGGIPEHIHSGGEATCVSRAVCEVCHEEYGELNKDNHKLKHVEAKAATVTQEGNIEYYYCSLCLKYFADSDASQQIDKDSVVTAKLAPVIIDGDKCVIEKNAGKEVTFKSNAAFSDFVKVELDGGELIKDKDYMVKEGSIIVTLNPNLIKKLSTGEHVIGIVSSSGTANAHFTVKEPETETESTKESETETETESIKEPETETETESTKEPETETETESTKELETETETESSRETESSTESIRETESSKETESIKESDSESTKATESGTANIKETETEAISQTESETTSQNTFDEAETNVPSTNTGDRNHGKLWLVIAIIALAGCIVAAAAYVVSKKK